jgi:biotin carboxyl carrier protein
MEAGSVHGELLMVPERVILAPAPGKFRPVDEARATDGTGSVGIDPEGNDLEGNDLGGAHVACEQVIGFVDGIGHSTPVRSPFHGRLMGLLASAGERVREGQPVAWLRMAH